MSLFSSIQMAGGSLKANEIALQVVGQNIANANTPGYLRETANFVPGPSQTAGALVQGSGVQIVSITQQVDKFLEGRLRNANADQAGTDTLKETYSQLEAIVGGLDSNSNLSGAMNQFFSAISNVLNQPDSVSVRQLAVMQGQSLVRSINTMSNNTVQLRAAVNDQVGSMAADINHLTNQIAQLNKRIAEVTGGGQLPSDAAGLADQRHQAVTDLAKLIGVQVNTQTDGSLSIYIGGSYLIDGSVARQIEVAYSSDHGQPISTLQVAGINTPLEPASGKLHGLISSRDDVLGGFQDQLNTFAGILTGEFNKIYSGGQGTSAYTQTTGLNSVSDPNASLDQAGLPSTPTNGSLQIIVMNKQTGASNTVDIPIALLGSGHNTSLNSLTAAINTNVSGLSAQVVNGKLSISSTDANTQFAFGSDTSGTLAALGINTFFTGTQVGNLGVNNTLLQDPTKFAASSKGVGKDTTNAQTLATFLTLPLATQNGSTIQSLYNNITTSVTQASANATASASAADTFQASLTSQQTAVSGVNIDEEAVNMLAYQRAYQASAKYISTLNDLLTMLVQL
ncbi:MAG: flagellar hook-associated protein FlgK [Planctomycetota bacterium]